MDIENDQIINSAEADAAVDSTYVVVSIILIFLFGLGLCALEGSFINYDLAIRRFGCSGPPMDGDLRHHH
jgi:hypothetical protein